MRSHPAVRVPDVRFKPQVAPVSALPLSLLLRDEQATHSELMINAIQRERLVERFHEQMRALEDESTELRSRLEDITEALQKHRKGLLLNQLPPERIRRWSGENESEPDDSKNVRRALDAEMFADSARTDDGPTEKKSTDDIMSTALSGGGSQRRRYERPSLSSLSDTITRRAFVPYVRRVAEGAAVVTRRPTFSDIAIMSCAAPRSLGRVVVALSGCGEGRTLMAESPTLVVPTARLVFRDVGSPSSSAMVSNSSDALNEASLWFPPLLSSIVQKFEREAGPVFNAHPTWDPNLILPFLSFVEAVCLRKPTETQASCVGADDAASLSFLIDALSNPLKVLDPDAVTEMASYANFLRLALPVKLQSALTDDDIAKFLLTFQVNAVAFRSNGAPELMTNNCITEPFAVRTQCRCLLGMVSMLEHSCNPNAVLSVRRAASLPADGSGNPLVVEVRALRDITPGEAAAISYVAPSLPRHERRHLLKSRYHFDCGCALCMEGTDVMRELRLQPSPDDVHGVRTAMPIGDGARWRIVSTGQDVSSADPVILAALQCEAAFSKEASSSTCCWADTGSVATWFARDAWREGASPVGVCHHYVFGTFLRLCKSIVDNAPLVESNLVHESLARYASSVAERVLNDLEGTDFHLKCVLWMEKPLDSLLLKVASLSSSDASRSQLRDRLLHGNTAVHREIDGVELRLKQLVTPKDSLVKGFAVSSALHVTLAVWESAFAAVHHICSTFSFSVSEDSPPHFRSLLALREALAVGAWVLIYYGMGSARTERALKWQAVLREIHQS